MDEDLWFTVESKVRKLVKDIVEPTIRRVQDFKEITDKLVRKEELNSEKAEAAEIVLAQTNQRVENLNNYSGKLIEAEANLRSLEFKLSASIDRILQRVDGIALDIVNLNEKTKVLDNQRVGIEERALGLEQSLIAVKNSIEVEVENHNEKNLRKFEQIETSIKTMDSNIRQTNRKLESISSDLAETDYLAKKSEKVVIEHSEKLIQIAKQAQVNKSELQESIEKLRNSMFAHYNEFIDFSKKIFKYIEGEYKVNLNLGMIEHLYSVAIDGKTRYKVAQYEQEKLHEWAGHYYQGPMREIIERAKIRSQAILDTPLPQSEFIRKMTLGSPKETLTKTQKDSTDRSLKAEEKSERTEKSSRIEKSERSEKTDKSEINEKNVKNDSEKNSYDSEESDIVEVPPHNTMEFSKNFFQQSTPSSTGFFSDSMFLQPQYDQIEMIDYMPFIQDLQQKLSDLKSEFSSETLALQKSIHKLRKETESQISAINKTHRDYSLQSSQKAKETEILLEEAIHECNKVVNIRKRDLTDINSSISELTYRIDNFYEDYSRHQESSEEVSKKLEVILEIIKIGNSLQEQDEIDRESISLMGQKEIKPSSRGASARRPVVSIDKTCLSCTAQSSVVFSSFKLACLAYTPSPVMYLKQVFSRKELIEIQRKMLEGAVTDNISNDIAKAIEEKLKNRAKSAFGSRRLRPSSGVYLGSSMTNAEIYSSMASELPTVKKLL